jgi:hypothetical protein
MNTSVEGTLGGYGPVHAPTSDEATLLANIPWLGMKFDAVSVQKQVVNGTNYCFYCIGTTATLHPTSGFVKVIVYAPISGNPIIKTVENVAAGHTPNPAPGGWSSVHKLDPESKKEFDIAISKVIGVKYDPLAVQAQIVAGTNYCYFCIGTLVGAEEPSGMYAVDTYAAPNRSPVVTHITQITP